MAVNLRPTFKEGDASKWELLAVFKFENSGDGDQRALICLLGTKLCFAMTLAVTIAGHDYLIESVASNEAFGQVYLYRLTLREAPVTGSLAAVRRHYHAAKRPFTFGAFMQNAKDSFYLALRASARHSSIPSASVLLRGAQRHLGDSRQEEAEAPFAQLPADIFVLRWQGLGVDAGLALTMNAAECEILYSTCGTQAFGGLDRGRMLCAMDAEVLAMLQPYYTPKINYTVQPPLTMQTQVFWDEPSFSSVAVQRDRLSRSAKVTIYSYQEQGEA